MAKQYIKIRGANEHNLKNIDISIPKNKLEAMRLLHPDIYQEYGKTTTSFSFYIKEEKAG